MKTFVFGTSNSILDGGYVRHLSLGLAELGIALDNHSIGDQTSITGLMRLMEKISEIQSGDVVLWEYPLLDALLSEAGYDPDLVLLAATTAWRLVLNCGAFPIVLVIEPRHQLGGSNSLLNALREIASRLGVGYVNVTDILATLEPTRDLSSFYVDDRHLDENGSAVRGVARQLCAIISTKLNAAPATPVTLVDLTDISPFLQSKMIWRGARALAEIVTPANQIVLFRNRFIEIEALSLQWPEGFAIPADEQLAAIGIISTSESGSIWCGHIGCPPVSCRLPDSLSRFSFLVRATRLPCLRLHHHPNVSAAPDWIIKTPGWADYGQDPLLQFGPVHMTGILTIVTNLGREQVAESRRQEAKNVLRRSVLFGVRRFFGKNPHRSLGKTH